MKTKPSLKKIKKGIDSYYKEQRQTRKKKSAKWIVKKMLKIIKQERTNHKHSPYDLSQMPPQKRHRKKQPKPLTVLYDLSSSEREKP